MRYRYIVFAGPVALACVAGLPGLAEVVRSVQHIRQRKRSWGKRRMQRAAPRAPTTATTRPARSRPLRSPGILFSASLPAGPSTSSWTSRRTCHRARSSRSVRRRTRTSSRTFSPETASRRVAPRLLINGAAVGVTGRTHGRGARKGRFPTWLGGASPRVVSVNSARRSPTPVQGTRSTGSRCLHADGVRCVVVLAVAFPHTPAIISDGVAGACRREQTRLVQSDRTTGPDHRRCHR